jgi:preprotein translocase SecE subunit
MQGAQADAPQQPKPKKAETKKSGNFVTDTVIFLKEVVKEAKKITWPPRSQVIQETTSVIVLVTLITVMVLGFDYALGNWIFGPIEHFAKVLAPKTPEQDMFDTSVPAPTPGNAVPHKSEAPVGPVPVQGAQPAPGATPGTSGAAPGATPTAPAGTTPVPTIPAGTVPVPATPGTTPAPTTGSTAAPAAPVTTPAPTAPVTTPAPTAPPATPGNVVPGATTPGTPKPATPTTPHP